MVRKISQKQKILTPGEKDELRTKYKSGMTMTVLADLYSCHYTTVSRILNNTKCFSVEDRQPKCIERLNIPTGINLEA